MPGDGSKLLTSIWVVICILVKCSSGKSRQVLAIVVTVCAAVTFVGVVVGFVGNGIVSEGIRDFIDRIVNTVEDIQMKADNITITMEQVFIRFTTC